MKKPGKDVILHIVRTVYFVEDTIHEFRHNHAPSHAMIDSAGLSQFLSTYLHGSMPGELHSHDHAEACAAQETWDEKTFRESFAGTSRRFGRTALVLSDFDLLQLTR